MGGADAGAVAGTRAERPPARSGEPIGWSKRDKRRFMGKNKRVTPVVARKGGIMFRWGALSEG